MHLRRATQQTISMLRILHVRWCTLHIAPCCIYTLYAQYDGCKQCIILRNLAILLFTALYLVKLHFGQQSIRLCIYIGTHQKIHQMISFVDIKKLWVLFFISLCPFRKFCPTPMPALLEHKFQLGLLSPTVTMYLYFCLFRYLYMFLCLYLFLYFPCVFLCWY